MFIHQIVSNEDGTKLVASAYSIEGGAGDDGGDIGTAYLIYYNFTSSSWICDSVNAVSGLSPNELPGIHCLCYGQGRFWAIRYTAQFVGSNAEITNGVLCSSTDGVSWTAHSSIVASKCGIINDEIWVYCVSDNNWYKFNTTNNTFVLQFAARTNNNPEVSLFAPCFIYSNDAIAPIELALNSNVWTYYYRTTSNTWDSYSTGIVASDAPDYMTTPVIGNGKLITLNEYLPAIDPPF